MATTIHFVFNQPWFIFALGKVSYTLGVPDTLFQYEERAELFRMRSYQVSSMGFDFPFITAANPGLRFEVRNSFRHGRGTILPGYRMRDQIVAAFMVEGYILNDVLADAEVANMQATLLGAGQPVAPRWDQMIQIRPRRVHWVFRSNLPFLHEANWMYPSPARLAQGPAVHQAGRIAHGLRATGETHFESTIDPACWVAAGNATLIEDLTIMENNWRGWIVCSQYLQCILDQRFR